MPPDRRRAEKRSARTYHLQLRPGDLPPYVLLPGDPARARRIAASWDSSEPLARHREFESYRGRHAGAEVSVVSVGIGGPAMSIVVEELARLGVRTVIRVGSSGAIDPRLRPGDLAISLAAARFETTTRVYAPPGYPAVADPDVFAALVGAARDLGVRWLAGITATVETFHRSQGRAGFRPLPPGEGVVDVPELRQLGILNIEMETSVLLTLGRLYGLRVGAVCAVYPEGKGGDPVPRGELASIRVANEALVRLSRADSVGARRRGPDATGVARHRGRT